MERRSFQSEENCRRVISVRPSVRKAHSIRFHLRVLTILPFFLVHLASASAEHRIVFREDGRFGGWPANNGAWAWGDEIAVAFGAGWVKEQPGDRHQLDWDKPLVPAIARSFDGGETWTIEMPPTLGRSTHDAGPFIPLVEPMDFSAPGFALTIRHVDNNVGPSFFLYSYDKGKTWRGPHEFPKLGVPAVLARTSYIVHGPKEATVFLTAAKSNLKEGRPYVARTADGGLTWQFLSYIGPEPAGFAIMPSVVMPDADTFLAVVRARSENERWIEAWISKDRGLTWESAGLPAPDLGGGSGNAPALVRLRDGRISLIYGYRGKPYGLRARLSDDGGMSWGDEIVLRDDAVTPDLGYPVAFQRLDGRIVIAYYYNDGPHNERFIAATIWDPVQP